MHTLNFAKKEDKQKTCTTSEYFRFGLVKTTCYTQKSELLTIDLKL